MALIEQSRRLMMGPARFQEGHAMEERLATTLHDLKHPLAVITALCRIGSRHIHDEQARQIFEQVQAQVDSSLAMLAELLPEQSVEPVVLLSPVALLTEVLREITPLCQVAGVEAALVVEGEARVRGRSRRLQRSIRNLISNALQAMPDGGMLTLRVGTADDHVLIALTDTGLGIPPAIQPQLFQPFVSGRPGGCGLGLYIVYQTITEQHGGRVWFETQPGRGTTFFVMLPAAA